MLLFLIERDEAENEKDSWYLKGKIRQGLARYSSVVDVYDTLQAKHRLEESGAKVGENRARRNRIAAVFIAIRNTFIFISNITCE